MTLHRSTLVMAAALTILGFAAVAEAATSKSTQAPLPTPASPRPAPTQVTVQNTCGLIETNFADPDWVMATSDRILRANLCLASPPCEAPFWYEKVFAPCYGENRYWKLAPNSGSAFVYPMSALGIGTFDGMYIRRSTKFRLYSGTGTGTPFGSAMTGPKYVSIDYWRDVNPACDGFEPGTFFVSGGPGALSDYSIKFGDDVTVVGDVDLRKTDNRKDHHTDKFTDDFVLRRATTFKLEVKLSEAYGPNCHEVYLEAEHDFDGAAATIEIPAFEAAVPPAEWGAERVSVTTNADKTRTVKLKVTIPPDAAVGKYTLKLLVREKGETDPVAEKAFTDPVVILFNPWGTDDAAYMASDAERKEYVETTTGVIWNGGRTSMGTLSWNYAQFDKTVLKATLNLLSGLTAAQRAQAHLVARWLSAKVNSNGGGVLQGRWGTDYSGGKKPWLWAGSDEILKQFDSSGGPVKYGQCWVFAGVLATTMRTLGIPSRPVTNFESAHDTDTPPNRAVDYYFKVDGTPNAARNDDSIWNFHVWVDAWMKRSDGGGDGWQAVDATPQEQSGGEFQMGPASHTAVKAGAGGNYDVAFVTAEVDADDKMWQEQPAAAPDKLIRTKDKHVGFFLSTKAVGGGGRNDVTAAYKTPETYTPMPQYLKGYGPAFESHAAGDGGILSDVIVGTVVPETVPLGQLIVWSVSLDNTSASSRTAHVILTASAVDYDGSIAAALAGLDQTVPLAPGQATSVTHVIDEASYTAYTGALRSFQASISVTLSDDPDPFLTVQRTQLVGAGVSVATTPSGSLPAGTSGTVDVSWQNPLGIALTNAVAVLSVDDGLTVAGGSQTEVALGTIGAGQSIGVSRPMGVLAGGVHRVNADIVADQLVDVSGFADVLTFSDCNGNAIDDSVEVANATVPDCNGNGVPDGCEVDCNGNGSPDDCDIGSAAAPDCNANGVPDACDIASGSPDVNGNGIPDACDLDCNHNGIPDATDVSTGSSYDTNMNGVPDECDTDCNSNAFSDELDIAEGRSADANQNGVPDECEGGAPLPQGTCCLSDASCTTATQGACTNQNGYYGGDGTTCVLTPCLVIASSDLCAGANSIPRCTNGTLVGDNSVASADYDPGDGGCASGYAEAGRDVVYKLDLIAGDQVDLTYRQSPYDAAFYIVTDCADLAGTCVAGADATVQGQPESINWTAPASGSYYLVLDSYGPGTGGPWTLNFEITCTLTDVDAPPIALATRLGEARPNPFRAETQIGFTLSKAASEAPVRLEIFDLAGHRVSTVFQGSLPPGSHSRSWNGRHDSGSRAESGIYFVRLSTSEGVRNSRVIRLR